MIDEDRTMQLFGYTSDELKPRSNRSIVVVCEECGQYRVMTKNELFARKNVDMLCRVCAARTPERRQQVSIANKNRPPCSDETRKKSSISLRNRPPFSQEHRDKISKSKLGKPTKLKGYERTFEERKRLSAINQGIEYDDWTGFSSRDRHNWGTATYLNEPFAGCHRHHITETIVIHIPAELHNHIPHNLLTGENMATINATALQFMA